MAEVTNFVVGYQMNEKWRLQYLSNLVGLPARLRF